MTLIIRLALGLVLLGLVGALLFSRLRPEQQETPSPSPEVAQSEAPVVIVTPEPLPSATPSLPDISNNTKAGGAAKGNDEPQQVEVIRTVTTTHVTRASQSEAHSASVSNGTESGSSSSSSSTSAWASASASGGTAKAEAKTW